MKINWDSFFGNSSTEEAIAYFCQKKYTFKEFSLACWPRACKNAIKKLKHMGYAKAIPAAKRAMRAREFSWSDWE